MKLKIKKKDYKKEIVQSDIENTSVKLFEEIKLMFNDLPSKLNNISYSEDRKHRQKLSPRIILDIMRMNENPRLNIRMGLTFYRDSMPWIYEEANYLLNNISDGNNIDEKKIYMQFEKLLMENRNMMMYQEYILNNRDDYILYEKLPMMIMRNVERLIKKRRV